MWSVLDIIRHARSYGMGFQAGQITIKELKSVEKVLAKEIKRRII